MRSLSLLPFIIVFYVLCSLNLYSQSLKDISFGDDITFEVVTWNLEFFPKNNSHTIDSVATAMLSLNADVYALQEIDNVEAFEILDQKLEGYSSLIVPDQYSNLKLAYLVKNEIEIVDFFPIYPSSSYSLMFASRPPLLAHIKVNNKELYIINVHFKCCGNGQLDYEDIYDEENRRLQASNQIKTYIDSFLPNKSVIILGDFNDLLEDTHTNNVFNTILMDTDNYLFADQPILDLPTYQWSFPSWPSHLDHILITNELFEFYQSTSQAIQSINVPSYFINGFNGYDAFISDHLPIGLKLNFNITELEEQQKQSPIINEIRDIQGRIIPKKSNQLHILKYNNGLVEKQYIIE